MQENSAFSAKYTISLFNVRKSYNCQKQDLRFSGAWALWIDAYKAEPQRGERCIDRDIRKISSPSGVKGVPQISRCGTVQVDWLAE